MQNMPFIPQSPSAGSDMAPITPGSHRSSESGTTRFSFAGLSAAQHEMKSTYADPTDDAAAQNKDSEKATSETSEQMLAQMREQFRKKEVQFKQRIQLLTTKINNANENVREKTTELSFAIASTQNEYGHLEQPVRE